MCYNYVIISGSFIILKMESEHIALWDILFHTGISVV